MQTLKDKGGGPSNAAGLKILGKHIGWHEQFLITEVQLKYVYGPDMQYTVCVYRPFKCIDVH